MTKQELKEKLIEIRDGGFITPLHEELWSLIKREEEVLEEIKKAEKALAEETNLNQQSFYEGYIKGLKFSQKTLDKREEEIIEKVEENTVWASNHSKRAILLEDLRNIIKNKK